MDHTHWEARFHRTGKILRGLIGIDDLSILVSYDPRHRRLSAFHRNHKSPDELWNHWIRGLRAGLEILIPGNVFILEPLTTAEFDQREEQESRSVEVLLRRPAIERIAELAMMKQERRVRK